MAILLEQQKYAPIPVAEFFRHLINNGLPVTTGQYEPIFSILGHFFPQGIEVNYFGTEIKADSASVELFLQIICPLIVKNQQEQERFFHIAREFFAEKLFDKYPSSQSQVSTTDDGDKENKDLLKQRRYLSIGMALVVLIVAVAGYIYCRQPKVIPKENPAYHTSPEPTPKPNNKFFSPKPEPLIQAIDRPLVTINYIFASFLFLCSASFGLLLLMAFRKRPVIVTKSKKPPFFLFVPEKDQLIRTTGIMYSWAKNLNQRKEGLRNMLDIKRSIAVSIRNGGYSTIVVKPIQQRTKYLFFIDFDYYDQQAYVFRFLANFFSAEAVDLEMVYFRSDPRTCWNANFPSGITLADLKITFPGHELALFTEGQSLVNFKNGRVFPWVRDGFSLWEKKVLVSPNLQEHWGYIEFALSDLFKVWPATVDGLTQMSEYLNVPGMEVLIPALQSLNMTVKAERNGRISMLTAESVTVADIKAFFADAHVDADCEKLLLQWAYATALYAAPTWDMTLLIGNAIRKASGYETLLTLPNLLLITSLPWLKVNYIPVSLRKSLLSGLEPVFQTEVTKAIIDTLNSKEFNGMDEESAAGLEKKVRILELNSLLRVKKDAEAGKKQLLPYYRAGMIKDPLVKELLIKKIRIGRLKRILLVAGIICLTFLCCFPLLTTKVYDQAVYHNNRAAVMANADLPLADSATYNGALGELRKSLASRQLFEAVYNLKALKYNLAVEQFRAALTSVRISKFFKEEDPRVIDSIIHPLRILFGKYYVPQEKEMTQYLLHVLADSADQAFDRYYGKFGSLNPQLDTVRILITRDTFKGCFITAHRLFNPFKILLPKSGGTVNINRAQISQQLNSLIRLDALFFILYEGGPNDSLTVKVASVSAPAVRRTSVDNQTPQPQEKQQKTIDTTVLGRLIPKPVTTTNVLRPKKQPAKSRNSINQGAYDTGRFFPDTGTTRPVKDTTKPNGLSVSAPIQRPSRQNNQPAADNYVQVEDSTKYISRNYGQTFFGNFDISVNSISKNQETVNVSFYTVSKGIFAKFKDDVDLDLNKEVTVFSPDGKYKYLVTLTRFGKVGLKTTGYFKVVTYQKK